MQIESSIISKILPHKYPFLLLDRVIKLEPGKSAVGIKNVTVNEPYFNGHFPEKPIMPGVLILESLAQLAAVMYCAEFFPEDTNWDILSSDNINFSEIASRVGYLAEVRNVKFKNIVRPGDTLKLSVMKTAQFQNLSQVKIGAHVDGKCIADGTISVSQRG
ncbi:MAG: 3-hydroxyacyl-ACP dehydratase FabZ [Hungatella sp.]|jgi:3-hydroxyacyl-[acyl-carrier-protein] dehydratase|nr:3-hydroxyacyl-ACP dehydratase FabZ [Hungatella sp.]